MLALKKLMRLHWLLAMIREYNQPIISKNIHMEQVQRYYMKKKKEIKCNNILKKFKND